MKSMKGIEWARTRTSSCYLTSQGLSFSLSLSSFEFICFEFKKILNCFVFWNSKWQPAEFKITESCLRLNNRNKTQIFNLDLKCSLSFSIRNFKYLLRFQSKSCSLGIMSYWWLYSPFNFFFLQLRQSSHFKQKRKRWKNIHAKETNIQSPITRIVSFVFLFG